MNREPRTLKISELKERFASIEFPEYQREPSVWNRDQKQRLIDSILRSFDIAAIYLYERPDGTWECIDGRQRLNAVMSFLGENRDGEDNGFRLSIDNEVAEDAGDELKDLQDKRFEDLDSVHQESILNYEFTAVILSGSRASSEFNLQFLRLNLGALINAGEKLHAMVGAMRDLLFESDRLGNHPFLKHVRVPTRRYARQLIAAQLMLQVSSMAEDNAFTRARHFDLQKYVKKHAEDAGPHVEDVTKTLDVMEAHGADLAKRLGNRAICVSVLLAAWALSIRDDGDLADTYVAFVNEFLDRLAYQVERMKKFDIDHAYDYLVVFQRDLTQAAVEKPAITNRHRTLVKGFETWRQTGLLLGDPEGAGPGN